MLVIPCPKSHVTRSVGMKLRHWKVDKLTDDIADVQAEMKDLWNTKWCHSKTNDAPGWRANFKPQKWP